MPCHRFQKFAAQAFTIGSGTRRRFVVRASVAITNAVLANNLGATVATISLDANLAFDTGCSVSVQAVGESLVDSALTPSASNYVVGASVVVAIMNNSTGLCNLDPTKGVNITYSLLETTTNFNCTAYVNGLYNPSFSFSAANVTFIAPNICRVSGSNIAVAVAPYTGSVAPIAAAVPSVPLPSASAVASSSVAPSGGTSTSVAPSGSGSSGNSTGSGSVVISASSFLVALALAFVALLL